MPRLTGLSVAAVLLACASTASAEGLEAHVGTWKLNVEKSRTEAWTPKSQTRVYEDRGDGLLHVRHDGMDGQGKPASGEYEARLDGKAYPYAVRGVKNALTISLTRVDDRTYTFAARTVYASAWVDRSGTVRDGKTLATGTHTVAPDGKSYTDSYRTDWKGEPRRAVLVFEKQ